MSEQCAGQPGRGQDGWGALLASEVSQKCRMQLLGDWEVRVDSRGGRWVTFSPKPPSSVLAKPTGSSLQSLEEPGLSPSLYRIYVLNLG